MTMVGYGDIAPTTVLGQIAAAGLVVLGYAIIATPTGIVSAEPVQAVSHQPVSTQACPACSAEGHDADAVCDKYCGERLYPTTMWSTRGPCGAAAWGPGQSAVKAGGTARPGARQCAPRGPGVGLWGPAWGTGRSSV